jgi:ribosomal protein L37AE/L43A
MKRRKLVKVERKPKYEEIEIELWECPKCEATLFSREYVFELQKVEAEDIYQAAFHHVPEKMRTRILCANCGHVVFQS